MGNVWFYVAIAVVLSIYITSSIWRKKWGIKLQQKDKNKFGMQQKWKCWTCGVVMLSSFECCVFDKNIRAVCINCGSLHKQNVV